MRKVGVILIVVLILTGCSAGRKGKSDVPAMAFTGNFVEDLKSQNLTNDGFFIEKGEVQIKGSDIDQKFIFSAKFKNGKYLISLKSKTGIEGARVYISGDSVLVNDRINKRLYSGSSIYLQRNFGLGLNVLPLLFGDVILDRNCENRPVTCTGETTKLDCIVKGLMIAYSIDCKKRKISAAEQDYGGGRTGAQIKYNHFFSSGGKFVPKTIELIQNQLQTNITINIIRLQSPWMGTISFIPGRDYEKIELL